MINDIKFYKFYDVEIYEIPKINEKSIQKPQPIYFTNLPDKKIIRDALGIANPVMKAIILFICSSGCGRAEYLSLTIHDYIDALSEYLPKNDLSIFEVIDLIDDDKTIIPTFNIRRKKTNKYYTIRLPLIILRSIFKKSMMIWVLEKSAHTTDSETICCGNSMQVHYIMTA